MKYSNSLDANKLFQKVSILQPSGDTTPIPVITTRLR